MKTLSDLSDKEVTETIRKNRGDALAKLYRSKDFLEVAEQSGIRPRILLTFLVFIKETGWCLSEEVKNKFRDRREHLEKVAESLTPLSDMEGMKTLQAQMMRKGLEMKSFIKKNGRKDEIHILMDAILNGRGEFSGNKNFNSWKALSRVLEKVDIHITDSALRRRAEIILKGESS